MSKIQYQSDELFAQEPTKLENLHPMSDVSKAMIVGKTYEEIQDTLINLVDNLNMDLVADGLEREDKLFIISRLAMRLSYRDILGQLNVFRGMRKKPPIAYFDIDKYKLEYKEKINGAFLSIADSFIEANPIINPMLKLMLNGEIAASNLLLLKEVQPTLVARLRTALENMDTDTAESYIRIYNVLVKSNIVLEEQMNKHIENYKPMLAKSNDKEINLDTMAKEYGVTQDELLSALAKLQEEKILKGIANNDKS